MRHTGPVVAFVAAALFWPMSAAMVVAQGSPTATMKAYYEAAKKKDFEALKRVVSSAYLKELAKAPFPPERIMEPLAEHLPPTMPDTRNEKISGDRATLEVRDDQRKQWETVTFVRENGVWKVALHEMK